MNAETAGTLVSYLESDLNVAVQVKWAARVAKARKLDLRLIQFVESGDERVSEVPLGEPATGDAAGIIAEVQRLIEESPDLSVGPWESEAKGEPAEVDIEQPVEHVVHVRMSLVYFASLPSLRRTVVDLAGEPGVEMGVAAHKRILGSGHELAAETGTLLRHVATEVVNCGGFGDEDWPQPRILLLMTPGRNGRAAAHLARDLAASTRGPLTALHVNPNVGVDSERVGERRLQRRLEDAFDTPPPDLRRRVVVNDQIHRGVGEVWDEGEYDLVIVGAAQSKLEGEVALKLGRDVPVAIVFAARPVINRVREFIEEGLERFVPQISREDRVGLVDRLQSNAAWNFDFIALMLLSTTMAAVGLMQNSAAVVIGAMLVAPLMTPLLGLGLAFVQGNPVLARVSLQSVSFGLGLALLVGLAVGSVTPGFVEPTREILARGGPGLMDLTVAFAAGLAAAYAMSRPGLLAALPGVAIAAALVPPIAASGLALSLGDFALASGALLLFIINMVTIVIASMISLWAVGLRVTRKVSHWTFVAGGVFLAATLGLGVFLSLEPRESEVAEEIPAGLVESVREGLSAGYRLENLTVAYDELGVQLNLVVAGPRPAAQELATKVRVIARDHYDQPVRVRLVTRIEVGAGPPK